MGRVKQTYRNVVMNGSYYLIKTILAFVVRTVFIYTFGMEYLGLNSLFANILAVLSLAELGIGSAIVYCMYKPMAIGDYKQVNSLMHLYKKFYAIIAVAIAVVGVAIIPILPLIVGEVSTGINITVVYAITLANVVISYFMAHRRALLLTSQNKYIESIIGIVTNIICVGLQFLAILVFKNYYLYVGCVIVSTLFDSIIVYIVTKRKFPLISGNAEPLDGKIKKQIRKNTSAIVCHRVGGVVLTSTDSLVIQLVLSDLIILARYSNYWLIYATIITILTFVLDAFQGSIGNLIAQSDEQHGYDVFKKLNFGFMWMVSFCTISMACLSNTFIANMWGQENVWDMQFVIVMVACFFVNMSRQLSYYFKISAGLFRPDRFAPIIEAILNIIISVVLVYFFGVTGVVLGTMISCLLVPFWNIPRILFKDYFKKGIIEYWKQLAFYAFTTILVGVVTYLICSRISDIGFGHMFAKFAICAVVPNVLFAVCYCWTPEFKYFLGLLKGIFRKKHKKLEQVDAMAGESDRLNGEERPSADDVLPVEEQEETKHKDENKE